jgi:hypothetical protein
MSLQTIAQRVLVVALISLASYHLYRLWANHKATTDAVMLVRDQTIRLGKVELGPVTATFVVRNDSEEESIRIDTLDAGCTCTQAEINSKQIGPGDSAKVRVHYRNDIPGAFHRTVIIHSNAANSPVLVHLQGKTVASPQPDKVSQQSE